MLKNRLFPIELTERNLPIHFQNMKVFSTTRVMEILKYSLKMILFLVKHHKDTFWLRHYHYDVFEGKDIDKTTGPDTTAGGISLNFRIECSGKN